jgi:hypothetical protein
MTRNAVQDALFGRIAARGIFTTEQKSACDPFERFQRVSLKNARRVTSTNQEDNTE